MTHPPGLDELTDLFLQLTPDNRGRVLEAARALVFAQGCERKKENKKISQTEGRKLKMKTGKWGKRFLAFLLVFVMAFAVMPPTRVEASWYNYNYVIKSITDMVEDVWELVVNVLELPVEIVVDFLVNEIISELSSAPAIKHYFQV
ncbi:MAG: hypothetical protein FWD90_02860 [Defluviitaleaceae bacterium]|nr:hypothetical protein [Defluviitaleaceae bacterium]